MRIQVHSPFFKRTHVLRLFFLICCLSWISLFAGDDSEDLTPSSPFEISDLSCGREFLVGGFINPLSGQICIHKTDLIAKGAQDIVVNRTYIPPFLPARCDKNPDRDKAMRYKHLWGNYRGFATLPHLSLKTKSNGRIQVVSQNGSLLDFKKTNSGDYVLDNPSYGISNYAAGKPGGQFDVRNIRVNRSDNMVTIHFPDGSRRIYTKLICHSYCLDKEILPSGKVIKYHYQNGDIRLIESTDPMEKHVYASVEIKGSKELGKQEFLASSGAFAKYSYETRMLQAEWKENGGRFKQELLSKPYLTVAEGTFFDKESFSYTHDLFLSECKSLSHPFKSLIGITKTRDNKYHYRVKNLIFDTSDDASFKGVENIEYTPPLPGRRNGETIVQYQDGAKIVYRYTDQLLPESVKSFQPDGSLKKTKIYVWDENNRLSCVQLFEGADELLYKKCYEYDDFGNPTLETITGKTESYCIRREFSQDGMNLLLKEQEESGKEVVYTYLAGTNLPTSKLTFENDTNFQREYWEYDDCHNLIRKIIDDGSSPGTERRMTTYTLRKEAPYLHMPEWIEEKYLQGEDEKTLRKIHLAYDSYGNVSQEDIYDSDGNFRYSIFKEYDKQGNLLSETNALGQSAYYGYDKTGNLLSETSFSGKFKKGYTYDFRGRRLTETHNGSKGELKTFSYEYDNYDQLIQKTENETNITRYAFDSVVLKPTTIQYPSISGSDVKISRTYDALGREIAITDPEGYTTLTIRNLYGLPLQIIHPDGTQEKFCYSKGGYLIEYLDQEGKKTVYDRDILGRVLKKTLFTPSNEEIGSETFVYNTFHLLQETDLEGYTTSYFYDGAGRKIKEEREGRITEYSYDSLGRLAAIKKNTLLHHTEYDLLDRVIQEAKTDLKGSVLYRVDYEYDEDGNRSAVTKNNQSEYFSYDAFGRIINHRDYEGNSTEYSFDDWHVNELGCHVLRKTAVDPLGRTTVSVYDPFERMSSVQQFDQNGTTLHFKEFEYDPRGNLVRISDDIHQNGRYQRTQTISHAYDSMNRLHSETHGFERTTRYCYHPSGCLATKSLPSGGVLKYSYNSLGFLESVNSSDGSINLIYRTNKLGDIIEASDLNQAYSLSREYDPFGNILREQTSDGLLLNKKYDGFSRPLVIDFSEGSLEYEYDPLNLRSVSRLNNQKNQIYKHTYNRYDKSGRLLEESLIGKLGTQNFRYDKNGRKTASSSPYLTQTCFYDELGNLIESQKDKTTDHYSYDPLSQLVSENDATYAYDSLFNRTRKNDEVLEYNHLNELQSRGEQKYEYDECGNLIHDGKRTYTYDLLNRLIEAKDNRHKFTYTYDPFDRRISKKTTLYSASEERILNEEIYFYDGQNELGAYTPDYQLKQLKVPGIRTYKDSYQPIAIELQDRIFVPILDCHGNIQKLVDIESKQITHEYNYTAFGETLFATESFHNPWRHAGKRLDPETGLIYYGKRYYNPSIGRWLTTDPAGTHDSTNLYQYLFNNPFQYCDPDGQFVFLIAIPLGEIILGTATAEAIIGAVVGAIAAFVVYEGTHYVEDCVNENLITDYDHILFSKNDGDFHPFPGTKPPANSNECPGEGFEKRGGSKGNWYNPNTQESLHPDLDHDPSIDPHWDYHDRNDPDNNGRWFLDGTFETK